MGALPEFDGPLGYECGYPRIAARWGPQHRREGRPTIGGRLTPRILAAQVYQVFAYSRRYPPETGPFARRCSVILRVLAGRTNLGIGVRQGDLSEGRLAAQVADQLP